MTNRFSAPWRIVEIPHGFAVDDAAGRKLGVFYGRAAPNMAGHTGFLTIDEARQLAVDFARLPELLKRASGAAKLLLLRSNSVDPYDASAHISPASGGKAVITAVAVVAGMLLLIGFVCGYGVRALTSRLQRAKARRRHFERLAKEVAERRKLIAARPGDRLAIGFQSGDGAQPPREGGASR